MTETSNKTIPTEIWSQCSAVKTTETMFRFGFSVLIGEMSERDREKMWTHRKCKNREEKEKEVLEKRSIV
jgi:U3 small nucleolar ribonucleoprotein component